MFPSFKRQDIHPAISWLFYDVFEFCIFPVHSEYFTDIKATCLVGQITILNWSSNTNEVPHHSVLPCTRRRKWCSGKNFHRL